MKDASLAIVPDFNNEVLLVKRRDVPVWVLPGGGIEPMETAEIAAERETFEEAGVDVKVVTHIATYLPVNRFTSTTHLFECHPAAPITLKLQDEEVSDAQFFSLTSLPPELLPLHKGFINEWQSGKSFPIVRPLTEASYSALFFLLLRYPLWSLKYLWTRWISTRL